MSEQSRLSGGDGDGRSASELFDPMALERRLNEARRRRAEAMAKRRREQGAGRGPHPSQLAGRTEILSAGLPHLGQPDAVGAAEVPRPPPVRRPATQYLEAWPEDETGSWRDVPLPRLGRFATFGLGFITAIAVVVAVQLGLQGDGSSSVPAVGAMPAGLANASSSAPRGQPLLAGVVAPLQGDLQPRMLERIAPDRWIRFSEAGDGTRPSLPAVSTQIVREPTVNPALRAPIAVDFETAPAAYVLSSIGAGGESSPTLPPAPRLGRISASATQPGLPLQEMILPAATGEAFMVDVSPEPGAIPVAGTSWVPPSEASAVVAAAAPAFILEPRAALGQKIRLVFGAETAPTQPSSEQVVLAALNADDLSGLVADQLAADVTVPESAGAAAYRVQVHAPSSSIAEGRSLAEVLRSGNAESVSVGPVNLAVSRPSVRYFHTSDFASAESVAAVAAERLGLSPESLLSDLTSFRPSPAEGHIEVWLAGAPPRPAAPVRSAPVASRTAPVSPARSQEIERILLERQVEQMLRQRVN